MSEEHIIPEAIGGILTCHFLCKNCNDKLGVHEAKLKEAPSWRLSIEKLQRQAPQLYESTVARQVFVGQSGSGPKAGYYRKNKRTGVLEFHLKEDGHPDGSFLQSTDEARKSFSKMLQKKGCSPSDIANALERFDAAPDDVRIAVAPGFEIVKSAVTSVEPKLDGRLLLVQINERGEEVLAGPGIALLKIAFEFLALHIGAEIYNPWFDSTRKALLDNDAALSPHRVEWKGGKKLEPFYGLLIERAPSHIVVQIRFFGEHVYRVHFPHLRVCEGFLRSKYTHDLLRGSEWCQKA